MTHNRKHTYVERELHRRRIAKRQQAIDNALNFVGGAAVVFGTEFSMLALFLMAI